MTIATHDRIRAHALFPRRAGLALIAAAALLAACSGKGGEGASQVVAAVGGEEITESQVNHALERQANLKPEQVESASRKVVSGLVEQEVVLQKARELKLDRDQRVVQNLEAVKREIVTRAYLDRIADGAAKPSPKDVQTYYEENPALFKQRRIYTFQELSVDASPEQAKEVEAQLAQLKSPSDLEDFLKAKKIPTRSTRSTINAENVPLPLLNRVAALKPGQGLIVPAAGGVRVLLLVSAQDSSVSEEQAQPAIQVFLTNQRKRLAVEKELASLKAATKVEFFGKYADLAASAPRPASGSAATAAPATPVQVSATSTTDQAQPQPK